MLGFINKIKFIKEFLPFKKGDKVFFGGEREVQDLIKFYLKNKGADNFEDNAKRFKINCVLGNNGGGKSRLFEGIINKEMEIDNIGDKEIILDDFFIFGKPFHLDENANKYLYSDLGANIKLGNERHIYIYNRVILLNFLFKKELDFSVLDAMIGKNLEFKYYKPKGELLLKKSIFKTAKKDEKIEKGKKGYLKKIKETVGSALEFKGVDIDLYKEVLVKLSLDSLSLKELEIIFKIYLNLKFNGKIIKNRYDINSDIEELNIEDLPAEFYKIEEYEFEGFLDALYEISRGLNLSEKILLFEFISRVLNVISVKISKGGEDYFDFLNLSAGEKVIFLRFSNIYIKIIKEYEEFKNKLRKEGKTEEEIKKDPFETVILIDEPDLHLHLDWQRQYIQKLIDVFSTLDTNIKLHFIIATHSPFVISDLPAECIVKLEGNGKEENGKKYTKVTDWWGNEFNNEEEFSEKKTGKGTFGANFVDLIRNGFFFKSKNLMGSFAEEVIDKIAQIEKDEIIKDKEVKDVSNIKKKIGDSFLRDNLLYFKKSKGDEKNKD